MKHVLKSWRHVFKLDPDRKLSDAELAAVMTSGTDAIIVGGSTGITYDKTEQLLWRLRSSSVPCVLEVSEQEAIPPDFDYYLIPVVLNTSDPRWIIQEQHRAIKKYDEWVPWDRMIAEGYVILNESAAVAKKTSAETKLEREDVLAYANIAGRLFQLPVFYLEYSGIFGDMQLVGEVADTLQGCRLFYGGGIDTVEKAVAAAEVADTVVVGNALYDHFEQALATVPAVKNKKERSEDHAANDRHF